MNQKILIETLILFKKNDQSRLANNIPITALLSYKQAINMRVAPTYLPPGIFLTTPRGIR